MKERLYNDYLMPNRYQEYEELLQKFINNNYIFICVKDYQLLNDINKKFIIIRHDIDSDVPIARKMFEIERKLGIKSTYYFRLATINKEFIQEIIQYGSEVGYHYEELAQFCKEHKKISSDFAIENLIIIKNKMTQNILFFEKENNMKIYSIASHRDFVNRKIDLTNQYVYQEDLQSKLGLIEAYSIEKMLDFRTADNIFHKYWKEELTKAIKENRKRVLILVHPRWWNKAPFSRLKLDIQRIIEEIKYRERGIK